VLLRTTLLDLLFELGKHLPQILGYLHVTRHKSIARCKFAHATQEDGRAACMPVALLERLDEIRGEVLLFGRHEGVRRALFACKQRRE
jgi:hypothetical protein